MMHSGKLKLLLNSFPLADNVKKVYHARNRAPVSLSSYFNMINGHPINFLIGNINVVTDTAARREQLPPVHSASSCLLFSS